MKGFFVTSATNETFKYGESFVAVPGNELVTAKYTNRVGKPGQGTTGMADEAILQAAKECAPEIIVYIGSRWGDLLSIPALKALRKIAPTVHICSDAADQPWWDLLVEYDKAGAFDLQVAIDGNKNWPLHETQLTSLTPFDPARYPDPMIAHAARPILFGYSGNLGGKGSVRKDMMDGMRALGLQIRERDVTPGVDTYKGFIEFVVQCRFIANFPHTGTQKYMHVKGRVVETGLAGAVLVEQRGAPTQDWFEPGVDYLEYGSAKEARQIVDHFASRPDESHAMAERMRTKVLRDHGPAQFWSRITDRVGIRAPVAA